MFSLWSLSTASHIVATRILAPTILPRVEVSLVAAERATSPKDELLSLSKEGLQPMDEGIRALASECILELERLTPTAQPAASPLLNGVWELAIPAVLGRGLVDSPTRELALAMYTAGYAPGTLLQLLGKLPAPLGVTLDGVTVTIRSADAGQPRVTTEVFSTALGEKREARLFSNLQQVSSVRLREDVIEAEVFGQRSLLPGPLARSRTLYVSYLDDELLIVRDESGSAEVLVRKQDMRFSAGADLSTPSYTDDDMTPGAS
mmetsp:Transcript_3122/g.6099  ORF Transcript_3122/g.6099 Transcript_3122/m.6099 type:complete len:262 (+) Transcript_3122:41-826(+)